MKILFDVSSLFRDGRVESGVPSYTLSLIEIFKSLPHEVIFFYSGRKSFGLEKYVSEYLHLPIPNKIIQLLTFLGVKYDWLIGKFGRWHISGNHESRITNQENSLLLPLRKGETKRGLFSSFKFDVYFTPNVVTFYRHLSSRIKVVGVVHDISHVLFPELKPFIERWKYFGQFKTHLVEKLIFWNRDRKPIFERFDHLVTISEHTKRDLVEFLKIPEEKIAVIYPTMHEARGTRHESGSRNENQKQESAVISSEAEGEVEKSQMLRSEPIMRSLDYARDDILNKYYIQKPYILFLGHIEPRKNVENLIRAYSLIKTRSTANKDTKYREMQLVVAGRMGYQSEKLLKLCEYLNLSFSSLRGFAKQSPSELEMRLPRSLTLPRNDNIRCDVVFTGPVSEEEKYALMRNAEVFVYPSLYEGFAYPCLEALSQGTPVVTSPVSALPEVLGEGALYADPWRPESITAIVQELLRDENLRNDLIQKGKKQVEKYQNLDLQARQWGFYLLVSKLDIRGYENK